MSNKVLLHCCCAPCTLLPLQVIEATGRQVTLFYYNPNIHPKEEYELRLNTLQEYAEANCLPLSVGLYDPETWEKDVGIYGGPYPLIPGADDYALMEEARKTRCRACYHLRFKTLAAYARERGGGCLEATLTISPYQFIEEALQLLRLCAAEQGIVALAHDWRGLYPESLQQSRALHMYRQNYCGCHYSEQEAALEREARKAARKKA